MGRPGRSATTQGVRVGTAGPVVELEAKRCRLFAMFSLSGVDTVRDA